MLAAAGQAVAPLYRRLRRLKNRALNLVDPPVIVLAYHRVTQLPSDPHQITVSPENFRAQMHYLERNCHCVRLDDDWSALRAPAVAVTFDDGYADNLYQALPILHQARVPATFFISTGMLDNHGEFWSDELEHLVLGTRDYPRGFSLQDRDFGGSWPATNREQRESLHARLHRCMLKVDAPRREAWLDQLRLWVGAGPSGRQEYRALRRDEVRTLAANPLVTIGAHGVTHTPLAELGEARQREEIGRSRGDLAELLGREIAVFSYPFGGRRQFDGTTLRLCREAGFRRAVTTLPGQVHRWSDPLQLPRQLVRNWDASTFAAKLEEFWA